MLKSKVAPLAGAALLALTAPAMGVEALKVTLPTLEVQEHKLANGLQVLMYEDHSEPVTTVEVWYRVGSKDERKGRSGFAHLFEHIMFKGSANLGPDEHKNYISSIGGRHNANTDFDRTLYYETFPANYLERVLWMEADRMRSLDISDENIKSERDVVKEERRLRVDNPPMMRLFEVMLENAYTTHPYQKLPIGKMTDLDAATLEDVRAFHSTYYVPDNATLIVAGDFDPFQAKKWVEKYFGPIPRGSKPVPRDIPPEPVQTAERHATDYHPNTTLPALVFTYHMPKSGTPDVYALKVASYVLFFGNSSRLNQRMIYTKQMAIGVGGQTIALQDPGVFFLYTILQPGQQPEAGEKEVLAEVSRLQEEPVTDDELAKAKNQLIAGLVFSRQTVLDKADAIGDAAVILGDLSLVNRHVAEYQKVTAADVQRVARTYLKPENRTVVYMLPEAMRPGAKDAAPSEVKKP